MQRLHAARHAMEIETLPPCEESVGSPNMCSINVQAVWLSASADLAVDATRDFWDIGAYK